MVALLLSGTLSAVAQKDATLETTRHEINDAGQPRVFEIALDELQAGGPSIRGRSVPALAASAEEIRQQAEQQSKTNAEEAELVLYEAGRPRTPEKV